MLAFLGLALLLSLTVVFPGRNCSNIQRRDDSKTSEANEYLDDVITKSIEENREKLEPCKIHNVTFTFQHKVLLITLTKEIHLDDLIIVGLTTLHREGDCERTNKNGVTKLSASLAMGLLEFESKGKFTKIGPSLSLSGKIGYCMLHLEVTRDNNAGTPPKVKKLEIYEQKGTEVKVSGLGPLNKFSELIIKATMKVLRGKINKQLEEKLMETLNEKFKDSIFPID